MKFESMGKALKVSDLAALDIMNVSAFREHARSAIRPEHNEFEIDFSTTRFLDSSGLSALIWIGRLMINRQGRLRILNPTPAVNQVLTTIQLNGVFTICFH